MRTFKQGNYYIPKDRKEAEALATLAKDCGVPNDGLNNYSDFVCNMIFTNTTVGFVSEPNMHNNHTQQLTLSQFIDCCLNWGKDEGVSEGVNDGATFEEGDYIPLRSDAEFRFYRDMAVKCGVDVLSSPTMNININELWVFDGEVLLGGDYEEGLTNLLTPEQFIQKCRNWNKTLESEATKILKDIKKEVKQELAELHQDSNHADSISAYETQVVCYRNFIRLLDEKIKSI